MIKVGLHFNLFEVPRCIRRGLIIQLNILLVVHFVPKAPLITA